jgi:hypothetical protein
MVFVVGSNHHSIPTFFIETSRSRDSLLMVLAFSQLPALAIDKQVTRVHDRSAAVMHLFFSVGRTNL